MKLISKIISISQRYYGSIPSDVRVRFAPSPTGFLHLGGLRTAFFNYLYAKKNKGKLVLRIEDTDQKRIKAGSLDNLNAMLQWAGIIPDESPTKGGPYGPYVQSERLEKYKKKARNLLYSDAAYRCFCSETRLSILKKEAQSNNIVRGYDNKCRHLTPSEVQQLLNEQKPYTIRFKVPKITISFEDIVYGTQTSNISENEGDFVILKSDGFPTYHFACVVDDHLMQISHVLRGAEWLISTPKHIMLHKAFDWEPPKFAHLPLLTNSDRSKLSKRQESIGIEYFKNKGYSPEALLNFLAASGGGFGKQEGCFVYDLETLCSKFNLESVNTSSCIVDLRKLDVFNHDHLKQQLLNDESTKKLIKDLRKILKLKFGEKYDEEKKNLSDSFLKKIILVYQDRMNVLSDLVENDMEYLWLSPKYENVMQMLSSLKIPDSTVCSLKDVKCLLLQIPDSEFTQKNLASSLKIISTQLNIKYVVLMRTLRVVLSSQKDGPGVAEIFEMLGKERSLKRISAIVDEIAKKESVTHPN